MHPRNAKISNASKALSFITMASSFSIFLLIGLMVAWKYFQVFVFNQSIPRSLTLGVLKR